MPGASPVRISRKDSDSNNDDDSDSKDSDEWEHSAGASDESSDDEPPKKKSRSKNSKVIARCSKPILSDFVTIPIITIYHSYHHNHHHLSVLSQPPLWEFLEGHKGISVAGKIHR